MSRQLFKKDINSYADMIDVESVLKEKTFSNSNLQYQNVKTKNWTINNHNISSYYTPGDNIYINIKIR